MKYTTEHNLITMVAFDYLLFFLISICSWSIPAWLIISSSTLFLITHAALAYRKSQLAYQKSQEQKMLPNQSVLIECLPVLGITCFFIFICWTKLYNPVYSMQLIVFFRATIRPLLGGLLLIQCEQNWHKQEHASNRFIVVMPALLFCVLLPIIQYYNCFGLLGFGSLLDEVKSYIFFILLAPLGMYTTENGLFMCKTFNPEKYPKYILGALTAMIAILIAHWSDILPLSIAFTLIPVSQYICYALFLIPVIFHQTLTEEFMFRSIPLWLSKQESTPIHLVPLILSAATFLFAFHHIFVLQIGISLLSLQWAMAIWLPPAIFLMLISLYADNGVEYSSGMHFGWNLAISLTAPIMIISSSYSGIWHIFLSNMFIEACQVAAIIGIDKLWHYTVGKPEITPKIDPATKTHTNQDHDTITVGQQPAKSNDLETPNFSAYYATEQTVLQRLFAPKETFV